MRGNGFYWVKFDTKPIVAEWVEFRWFIAGYSGSFCDSRFCEINENAIIQEA